MTEDGLPSVLTIIKAIALADGVLRGGEGYLTKYQMIQLCKNFLEPMASMENPPGIVTPTSLEKVSKIFLRSAGVVVNPRVT